MQRPTTSGSRQAPDPYDQFLEEHNLYRKHTARDASCLFRVIAEQMYDTQVLHSDIRLECVQYMTQNRAIFEQYVDRDFDDYLLNLSKPKTLGTLLELRALSYMYKRNVLLYQPYDLGNFFVLRHHYEGEFRIFYTFDYHFDSVFMADFIQEAAMCQSICYDLLYRMFFKIPDVDYAVEKMLHPCSFERDTFKAAFNTNGYMVEIVTDDEREFQLDLPAKTNCILENYKQCNFHCHILSMADSTKIAEDSSSLVDNGNHNETDDVIDSLLPHKLISCVRQLLDDDITPFPYKVAKSLDPNMYRNIEFDCWNETRKEERRYSTYKGDSNFKLNAFLIKITNAIKSQKYLLAIIGIGLKTSRRDLFSNFLDASSWNDYGSQKECKVGAKCNVKLPLSEHELFTCHIQEMPKDKLYCVVYVEKLGEKHVVPYDALSPLPVGEFKPWGLPVRLQRQLQKFNYPKYASKLRPSWKKAKCIIYSSAETLNMDSFKNGVGNYCKLQPYVKLNNMNQQPVEYYTYPVSVARPIATAMNGGDACSNIDNENVFEGNVDIVNATNAVYRTDKAMSYNITNAVCEEPRILHKEMSVDSSAASSGQMSQVVGNIDPSMIVPSTVINAGVYPGFAFAPPIYPPPNVPIFFTEGYPTSPQLIQAECGTCFYVPSAYPQGLNGSMPIMHAPPLPPYQVYPPGTTLYPFSFFVPPPPVGMVPQMLPITDTPVLGDETNPYNDRNEPISRYVENRYVKPCNDQAGYSPICGESTQCKYSFMPLPKPVINASDPIRYEVPSNIQSQTVVPICDKEYYTASRRVKNEYTQVPDKIFDNVANGNININVHAAYPSMNSNGQDLPAETPTLRYFYNVNVDQHPQLVQPQCIFQPQSNISRVEHQQSVFPNLQVHDGETEIDPTKSHNNGVVNTHVNSASNHHQLKRTNFTAVTAFPPNQPHFIDPSNNGLFANDCHLNTIGGHPGMVGRPTNELTFYEMLPGVLMDNENRSIAGDCNDGIKNAQVNQPTKFKQK